MERGFSSTFSIRYTSLMILASASLLFVDCSTDSEEMLKSNNALCIDVTFDDAMTRAAEPLNGGSFSGSASLGVSLYKEDKSDLYGSATSNVSYTTTDGLSWSSSSIISLNANLGVVTAYYPYTADVDITAVPMKTSDPKDWMYQPFSEATYSATSSHADIALKHAQAVIKVIINKSSVNPYTGSGAISDITIASPSFATTSTLNTQTGDIAGSAEAVSETYLDKFVAASGNTTILDQWFVAPIKEDENATISFSVKIDGITYSVNDVSVVSGSAPSPIKRGNAYTFTLNLNAKSLTLGSVSIAGWEAGDPISGDLIPVRYATLIEGKNFNEAIKKLANPTQTLEYDGWSDTNIKHIVFENNSEVVSGKLLSDNNSIPIYANWDKETATITISTAADRIMAPADFSSAFRGYYYLEEIANIEMLNTVNVTSMAYMFARMYSMRSLDLSSFCTSNVMDMCCMFRDNFAVRSINLSNFDTRNVVNMSAMFYECSDLKSLNLSSFNTSKVETMQTMFKNCVALETLDISNFETTSIAEKLLGLYEMFYYAKSVRSINLGHNFIIPNTQASQDMFNIFANSVESCEITCSEAVKASIMDHDDWLYNLRFDKNSPKWQWNIIE